jgi:hypothetical protein
MAENKKSFILYADLIHTIKKMPQDKAGLLFLTILEYVNDLNPQVDDIIVDLCFEPIKQQLKRDLITWDKFKEKQSLNGKKGGRPKQIEDNQIKPKNPSLFQETQKSLNVNVTVNDNVIIFKYKKCSDKEFIDELSKYKDKYSKDILNSFYRYWSEKNDKGKMRMAMENTFEVDKRLITWENNNKKFNKAENKIEEKKIIW